MFSFFRLFKRRTPSPAPFLGPFVSGNVAGMVKTVSGGSGGISEPACYGSGGCGSICIVTPLPCPVPPSVDHLITKSGVYRKLEAGEHSRRMYSDRYGSRWVSLKESADVSNR